MSRSLFTVILAALIAAFAVSMQHWRPHAPHGLGTIDVILEDR